MTQVHKTPVPLPLQKDANENVVITEKCLVSLTINTNRTIQPS